MAFAPIGPITSFAGTLAAAVGAGILLGGFAAGTYRLMTGSSRRTLERHVLTDGYYGGVICVGLLLIDIALRYI